MGRLSMAWARLERAELSFANASTGTEHANAQCHDTRTLLPWSTDGMLAQSIRSTASDSEPPKPSRWPTPCRELAVQTLPERTAYLRYNTMSAIAGAAGSLPFRPAGRKIKQHRRKKESGATGSWDHVRELARTKEEEDTTVASLAIVAESQEGSVKIVIPPVLPGRFVARPPSRAAAGDSLTPTASV